MEFTPTESNASIVDREALSTFLTATNFGQELWIKASWDFEDVGHPKWWKTKRDETPVNYLFNLNTSTDTLTVFKWGGKDADGDAIWTPDRVQNDGFNRLRELSNAGATIYYYPNKPKGGICNKHVSDTDLLFYEIDHKSLDEQEQAVEALKELGLKPAGVVFTGGKSLHTYIRLNQKVDPQTWLRLNRKLCIVQDGDPAVCNVARAMRLPGMVRRKSVDGALTEPKEISLLESSDCTYSPEEIERALDSTGLFPNELTYERWKLWRNSAIKARVGEDCNPLDALLKSDEELSLKNTGTQADRALIENGASKGFRNTPGTKLGGSFVPTAKNNPCPICDEATGKCRQGVSDPDFILCSGFPNTKLGKIVDGWKSLGATKDGFWCKYKPDNSGEWSEERQHIHDEAKRIIAVDTAKRESDAKTRSLSAIERYEGYTQLFSELTLHPDDKADLIKRGFTDEQIILSGFKSIKPYQRLNGKYHRFLPGIKRNSISLPYAGYLCPVRDSEGLIVACQIRLRNALDGGRYRWLSGGEGTLHLYPNEEKELPLAVFIPEKKPEGVSFVEGVGAKPFLVSQRLNQLVVGAAGGQWANSKAALESCLANWNGNKEIIFFPDAGDVFNHQVMGRWNNAELALKELGWDVRWAWWGQLHKGSGDIDEIDLTKTKINYYTPDDFQFIVGKIVSDWEKSEAIRKAQEPLRSLTYKPDLILETRYIPLSIIPLLPKSGIIAIQKNKGSGKSRLQAEIIRIASFEGEGYILSITPRIALGREQATKWKITWIGDKGKTRVVAQSSEAEDKQLAELTTKRAELEEKLKIIEETPIQLSLLSNEQRQDEIINLRASVDELSERIENLVSSSWRKLGLCWDSLWKTKGMDMKNSLILLDEAEMGLTHMVMSKTCRRNRAEILKVYTDKICENLLNGGRVVVADADLTDIPIDYINSLLPAPIKPYVITGKFMDETTRWHVSFRTGSKDCTTDEVIARLKRDERLAVTCDSQAEAEALEKLILKEIPDFCPFIENEEITDKAKAGQPCIIRIDRKITGCEAGKYFVEHPNEEILKWQPRCLIYTPSMGIGVSIDEHVVRVNDFNITVPYFDVVFGFFFGVIEPSQCRQQLARFRANVPRILWATARGMPGEGCQSFFPEEVNRQTMKYRLEGALDITELAEANLKEFCLSKGKKSFDDFELMDEAVRLKSQFFDENSRLWNNPHITLYSKIKARNNYGRAHLAELLEKELREEGHNVFLMPGQKSQVGEILAGFKEEARQEEALGISEAPEKTEAEIQELERNPTKTKAESYSVSKFRLRQSLPDLDLSPEYVLKAKVENNGQWLAAQCRFYYLKNIEAIKEKDCNEIMKSLYSWAKGTACGWDSHQELPKIKAIIATGLFDWINLDDTEKEYSSKSEEAEAFLRRCLKIKKQLYTVFNVSINKKSSSVRTAKYLLRKIGLGTKDLEGSRKNGRRFRIDEELLNDPDRIATLKALHRAWESRNNEAVTEVVEPSQEALGTVSFSSTPTKEEKLEIDTPSEAEIGHLFEVKKIEGCLGNTNNKPVEVWETNYKLQELPSQFQDMYVFESPDGERIPVYDGNFRPMDEAHKLARKFCLDVERRLNAKIPLVENADEMISLYTECEKKFELGLVSGELFLRVVAALGKAGIWFDECPNVEEALAF